MKFKVGDKVMVKKNSKIDGGAYAGKTGVVEYVDRGETFPYDVVLYGRPCPILLHANELIKVEVRDEVER